MQKPQFKGYILEELLAYLMRSCGYQLINKANNDPSLINKNNGLNVRGRGTYHQIDVLGDLKQLPAFSYPVRLSIEAKFKTKTQGVDVVRSAIGILKDINENYFTDLESPLGNRYLYNFVIFSTSGFTAGAIDLAIAHNIALIDLSDRVYSYLKDVIEVFTNEVFGEQAEVDATIVTQIRNKIRLGLYPLEITLNTDLITEDVSIAINKLITEIKLKKALVGMTKGGYIIFLYSDNLDEFLRYAKKNLNHEIMIRYGENENELVRYINPIHRGHYQLIFKLSQRLSDIIITSDKRIENALALKRNHLGTISIYYTEDNKDYVFNLNYKEPSREQ